jgi:hypothetical protein
MSEAAYLSVGDNMATHPLGVWDFGSMRQNANLMICICDWIVPGHDAVFQVGQLYRNTHTRVHFMYV